MTHDHEPAYRQHCEHEPGLRPLTTRHRPAEAACHPACQPTSATSSAKPVTSSNGSPATPDEIPVDGDNRGRFIGARGDYARTDEQIREVRDHASRGLEASDLPDPLDLSDARNPWRWPTTWMHAAWLHGVRDLLDWVLGDRATSAFGQQVTGLPTVHDLECEDLQADDVASQGRPGGIMVDPDIYPTPQYAEGIKAAVHWLRGETTVSPVDRNGRSPYF